ncbi:MAG: UDP binding domain-containing protein, partial [Candidatus Bathyarchaeia archaeon]
TLNSLTRCRRIVAASDRTGLEKALNVIGAVTEGGVTATLNFKVAEAAALYESVYRSVSFALANEFTLLCEKVGVDYLAVQSLLFPVTEAYQQALDCLGREPLLMLLEEAENQNVKLRTPQAALDSSNEVVRHGVSLIQKALKDCGKTMRRAKIAVLGVSQTQNTADNPKNMVKSIAKILEKKGAKLSFYDPFLHGKTVDLEGQSLDESLVKAVEGADCIVIFTGHDQFKKLNLGKIKLLAKTPTAIVDFEGVLDPSKVEDEGFIYRGFGRGVHRK